MQPASGIVRLGLCAALLAGPAAAQSSAPGVPLNVELFNVTPTTTLSISFQGMRFLGPAVPASGTSSAIVAGVSTTGTTLTFSPPSGSLPAGDFSTVSFSFLVEITAHLTGSATAQKPLVVYLTTPYGAALNQGGSFGIPTPALPPTCTLAGCGPGTLCPADEKRTCSEYLGYLYCCVGSPTDARRVGKPTRPHG